MVVMQVRRQSGTLSMIRSRYAPVVKPHRIVASIASDRGLATTRGLWIRPRLRYAPADHDEFAYHLDP